MTTLFRFAAKMSYDIACITVGTVLLWKREFEDVVDRGWLHPSATFDTVSFRDMEH